MHVTTEAFEKAHKSFYESDTFNGPSLYFHIETLKAAKSENLERFTEMAYAMLPAWGMHRGGKGPQLKPYDQFQEQIEKIWMLCLEIRRSKAFEIEAMEETFLNLELTHKSKPRLIVNSKLLAHLCPNMVAPIDRKYTLQFFKQSGHVPASVDRQWNLFKSIHKEMYYPLAGFVQRTKLCSFLDEKLFIWNTSVLKLVDNLVVGFSLDKKTKEDIQWL